LYGWESGIIVKMSVFCGNTRDFLMDVVTPVHTFEFIGCVFSAASLPDGSFEGATAGNLFGVLTESLPLQHLSSQACQPKITRSESASLQFTPPLYEPPNRRSGFVATGLFLFFGLPWDRA
jgi:hypothetical protein